MHPKAFGFWPPELEAEQIDNDSSVPGATVKDALDALLALGPTGPVSSVFGRVGAVVALLGDYAASLVTNDSGVTGATVKDALDELAAEIAAIPPAPVSSVFGRIGAVVAAVNDYAASQVNNDSTVTGATVKDALQQLRADILAIVATIAALTSSDIGNASAVAGATVTAALNALLAAIPAVPVSSVFGRVGAVVAAVNDYAASQVSNDSSVAGATVKAALNTLLSSGGAVASVFGRTGAVVAAANDYAASQVNNDSSVTGADVKAALNTLLAAIPTSTVAAFLADIPPSSPPSQNDEFPAGAVNARWSTWDGGGILTATCTASGLKLSITSTAATQAAGIYQATPAAEFVAYAKLGLDSAPPAGGVDLSLSVFQNAANTALAWRSNGVASADIYVARTWAAYNSGSATAVTAANGTPTFVYVRVRCNGTACAVDTSLDGLKWLQLVTVTLAFTPSHVGLTLRLGTTTTTAVGYVRFFRVVTGAGCSAFYGSTLPGGAWKNVVYT